MLNLSKACTRLYCFVKRLATRLKVNLLKESGFQVGWVRDKLRGNCFDKHKKVMTTDFLFSKLGLLLERGQVPEQVPMCL